MPNTHRNVVHRGQDTCWTSPASGQSCTSADGSEYRSIAIVPPCAAKIVQLLVDGEVLVSQQTLGLDSHPEARNTSTDDDHFPLRGHGTRWGARFWFNY